MLRDIFFPGVSIVLTVAFHLVACSGRPVATTNRQSSTPEKTVSKNIAPKNTATHNTYIEAVRFSNDGRYLFSFGKSDGRVISWDLLSNEPPRELVAAHGRSTVFEVDPHGSYIVYTSGNRLHFYDYEKNQEVQLLAETKADHRNRLWPPQAYDFAYSETGEYMVFDTASEVQIRKWEPSTRKYILHNAILTHQMVSVVPGRHQVAFQFPDLVYFIDFDTLKEVQRIRTSENGGFIFQVLFNKDVSRGYVMTENGHFSVFVPDTGDVLTSGWSYKEKTDVRIDRLLMDESRGRLLGFKSLYGTFAIVVFDLDSGTPIKDIHPHLPHPCEKMRGCGTEVLDVALSPDGKTLAVAGEDCAITLFDADSFVEKAVLGAECQLNKTLRECPVSDCE